MQAELCGADCGHAGYPQILGQVTLDANLGYVRTRIYWHCCLL
jgi:hypothetical protein